MFILKKEFLEEIIAQSKKESPNEACGILAGRGNKVQKVYKMTNTDRSPSAYFMDAKEQFKVTKEIRSLGLEMLGIYHSHVASPARPSTHDIELALYPEAAYVIVSLQDQNNPVVRSFKIKEGKVTEEQLKIEGE